MSVSPPDVTHAWGLLWATIFGAAVGVVAGTLIQYFLSLALEGRSKARQKNALIKEMYYNRSLINELIDDVHKLRNSVNAGVLDKYVGYFAFGNGIFVQTNGSATSGMLYEIFSIDEIKSAQRIVSQLSTNNANWVNGEITNRKVRFTNDPGSFDKHETVQFVNFLEEAVRDLGKQVDGLIKKLQQ